MRWKLISWNCCLPPWSLNRNRRLPLIASTILKENPDLICLQEVFFESDASYLIKKFFQKGFGQSFKYQDLLIASKKPILSSYAAKFKDQGKIFSFSALDAIYGKAFQAISLQLKSHKLTLANTHLLSAYALSGKNYQDTRVRQVREILAYLKTLGHNNIAVVGDFNFEPETKPYHIFEELGFVDLSYHIPKNTTKKLDFVFDKNLALKVTAAGSKFTELSDHAYLTLELEISN